MLQIGRFIDNDSISLEVFERLKKEPDKEDDSSFLWWNWNRYKTEKELSSYFQLTI
jgi:hypothetical protein